MLQKQSSTTDKGVISSPELKDGPLKSRSCTDVFCLLIFILFLISSAGLIGYAIFKGNPGALTIPYDPDQNGCGIGKTKDYPFIYFANPFDLRYLFQTVCVKTCPNDLTLKELDCFPNSLVTSCKVSTTQKAFEEEEFLVFEEGEEQVFVAELTDKEKAAPAKIVLVNTFAMNTACVPVLQAAQDNFNLGTKTGVVISLVNDVRKIWTLMLICLGLAIVASFIFINLLRYCTGLVTWILILGTISMFALAGTFFYYYTTHDLPQLTNT